MSTNEETPHDSGRAGGPLPITWWAKAGAGYALAVAVLLAFAKGLIWALDAIGDGLYWIGVVTRVDRFWIGVVAVVAVVAPAVALFQEVWSMLRGWVEPRNWAERWLVMVFWALVTAAAAWVFSPELAKAWEGLIENGPGIMFLGLVVLFIVMVERISHFLEQRDSARRERDSAIDCFLTTCNERDSAIDERDSAIAERDSAIAERDTAIDWLATAANADDSDEAEIWDDDNDDASEDGESDDDYDGEEESEDGACAERAEEKRFAAVDAWGKDEWAAWAAARVRAAEAKEARMEMTEAERVAAKDMRLAMVEGVKTEMGDMWRAMTAAEKEEAWAMAEAEAWEAGERVAAEKAKRGK